MPVIIRNLTLRPVLLTLSSGATLHLAPYASSPELNNVEVQDNPKIAKLKNQLVIAVDDAPAGSKASASESKSAHKKSTEEKTLRDGAENA